MDARISIKSILGEIHPSSQRFWMLRRNFQRRGLHDEEMIERSQAKFLTEVPIGQNFDSKNEKLTLWFLSLAVPHTLTGSNDRHPSEQVHLPSNSAKIGNRYQQCLLSPQPINSNIHMAGICDAFRPGAN